jgi:lysylphosphatidylglycerol synthetase-like protein (DUF2156 family)
VTVSGRTATPIGHRTDRSTRIAGRLRPAVRLVRAAPFCVTATAALWAVGATTGSLLTGPGPALDAAIGLGARALAQGHWWAPASSVWWSSGLPGYLAVTVLLLAVCAPMERRIGTLRAALLFGASQLAGAALALGAIWLGVRTGDVWATHLARGVAVGPSPGAVGLLLAGSAQLDPLWRRRVRVLVMATLITTTLYAGDLPDTVRLAAGTTGLVAGVLTLPRQKTTLAPIRPGGDRRALIALLVAASALGPLSTILEAHRFGPLSTLNFLFLPSLNARGVLRWCTNTASAGGYQCTVASTAYLIQGIGPLFQTALPALVLLTLAEGLRRGRRAAYLGTVIANVVLALVGALLSHRELAHLASANAGRPIVGSEFWITRLAPVVLPLAIALVVLVHRREFGVRLPWRLNRPAVLAIAAAAIVVTAAYLGVGWAVRSQFQPEPTMRQLLASLPERFAPAGYLGAGREHLLPVGPVAVALYEWAGAVFWGVVLIMTLAHFWRSRSIDLPPDRAAAAGVLRSHGGASSLAYMTLWPGNHYFFTPDGSTYIGYRVIATVAVTTGDPIGPRPRRALDGFLAHCAAAGWTPCFFSVTPTTADLLRRHGFRTLQVASDTVIDLRTLAFTGKRWQDVRSALNRARREEVRAEWSAYLGLPRALADQVVHIDEQWLAGKQLPEMGFTLGGLTELHDPAVRCLLAVTAAGHVQAVTSWLPGYRDERIVGWTLDYMRRGPDAFPGSMEFLIATALTTFRDEGAEWVSLSGVPLAWPAGAEPTGTLGRATEALAAVLEPVYGFRSLLAFKAKFDPQYRPLLLAYPDPAALPAVVNAVMRAYVPHLGATQLTRLVRRLLLPDRVPARV